MNRLRIGLTMRAVATETEERDCLASDWPEFLARELPWASWVVLPNLGAATVGYAQAEGVNALILTGGNDLGTSPRRDSSEAALLDWALTKDLRVLGVCRGLQFLCHFFGGVLVPLEGHVAVEHPLDWFVEVPASGAFVNSYHNYGVAEAPAPLEVLARSRDAGIEAVRVPGRPVLAIMWHPERAMGGDGKRLTRWLLGEVFGSEPGKLA